MVKHTKNLCKLTNKNKIYRYSYHLTVYMQKTKPVRRLYDTDIMHAHICKYVRAI